MHIAKLGLSVVVILSQNAFALRGGEINPTGQYGGKQAPEWKPEWSKAFFTCAEKIPEVKEMFDKMSNGEVNDLGPGRPWCQNSDVYRPENVRLFQLATFKLLAEPESSYKPDAKNPNSPNPPAVGLLQIGPKDVQWHKCVTPDGKPMSGVADLEKAENNICCGLKIAADEYKKQAKNGKKVVFAQQKEGIMGKFWEPMRVQNSKGAQGDAMREKINKVCEASFRPGGTLTSAEVEQARTVPFTSATRQYADNIDLTSGGVR